MFVSGGTCLRELHKVVAFGETVAGIVGAQRRHADIRLCAGIRRVRGRWVEGQRPRAAWNSVRCRGDAQRWTCK